MVADLLNEQALMFMATTEVLYLTAHVSDNVRWVASDHGALEQGAGC